MTSTATAPPETAPAPEPTAPARPARRHTPAWLVLPSLVLLVAALGYPVGWQVVTSFQHFGMMQQFGQPPEWVGLANYASLVTDPELWVIVGRSIGFCLVCALSTVAIGLGLALLMGAVSRAGRLVLQVALLLAWAMPVVASMTVWTWIVNWRNGLLNWVLEQIGIDAAGHNWLVQPLSFFVVAAVILPLVAPVTAIVLLLQLTWKLRVFTQVKLLEDTGGVANETHLLGTYSY